MATDALVPHPRLCRECRTLLRDGEECPFQHASDRLALTNKDQRLALRHDLAQKLRASRRPPVVGALAAGVVMSVLLLRFGLLGPAIWSAIFFTAAVTVVKVRRARRVIAFGGAARWTSAVRGRIAGGQPLRAPGTGRPCLAYAILLSVRDVPLLRESRTAGFDVKLDDGRLVRVPPGTIVVEARCSAMRRLTAAEADALTQAIDPLDPAPALDVFPFDDARELAFLDGDRVELGATLEKVLEGEAGYREPPHEVWKPSRTPAIRKI